MSREMKDSGVEWIGEIPINWQSTALRRVLKYPITDGPHETPTYLDDGIPFVSVDSLDESESVNLSIVRKFISEEDYERFNKKTQIRKGDILFTKAATIGKTAIVGDEKYMVWSPIAVIKSNEELVFNKFVYYVLGTEKFIKYASLLGTNNTQINLGMRALEKAVVPLPKSIDEQISISELLTKKVEKVDSLIVKTKSTIEDYKLLKQSIITEAVTKGLDKNVEMKDSGNRWVGYIPIEWGYTSLKNVLAIPITDGPHETPALYDEGMPFVSAEAIKKEKIDFTKVRGYISTEDHIKYCMKVKPQRNDIFMIKSGATTGNIAVVETDDEFSIWSPLALIRSDKEIIDYKFLFYYMQSKNFRIQVEQFWNYGTQQNIGMKVLGTLQVVLPNLNFQKHISNYLDDSVKQVNKLIEEKSKLIDELESYKKSLIYEYVTGKKELKSRGWNDAENNNISLS